MEFTEEDIAPALTNVNATEEMNAQVLRVFRNLEKTNELLNQQSARLKQDIYSSEDTLASMGGRRRATRSSTHDNSLNPAIWSALPLHVLQLVFAHLPLPHIIRLRVLSKIWDGYVTGALPGFTKVCAEVNPNVFGMLCEGHVYDEAGVMAVRLHDNDSNRWHRFPHVTPRDEFIETMRAGDGGLVCIISLTKDKKKYTLRIVVFNPLTRQLRELPELPHVLRSVQPSMVQLVMNRNSKCYKVIVRFRRKGVGVAW